MNVHRILLSLAIIAFAGGAVAGGTGAFFSDEETSTDNIFTAGALDLKVDSVAHINGLVCFDSAWVPESEVVWNGEEEKLELVEDADVEGAIEDYNTDFPSNVPAAGDDCGGTWALTDLGPENTFFDFNDLKPGDTGENTISLHVFDNDAYMCAAIHDVESADNGCNEPETEAGDTSCGTPGLAEGDLVKEVTFRIWEDDGDNIQQEQEEILYEGLASDTMTGVYPLYTPANQSVFPGGETKYLAVAWCYGEFDGTTCDGAPVSNMSQTDSLAADITFYVEQARNNEEFTCPDISEFERPEKETAPDEELE